MMYRLVEKWAGGHCRLIVMPDRPSRGGGRSPGGDPTSDFRQRLNDRTALEKLEMLVESNFFLNDLFVTLTYDDDHLPRNYDESKKILQRFIRSYREQRKAAGYDYVYVYVVEGEHGDNRIHHHVIAPSSDAGAAAFRELWNHGNVHIETIRDFAEKPVRGFRTIDLADCIRQMDGDEDRGKGLYVISCYKKVCAYMTKEPRKSGRARLGDRMFTPAKGMRRPVEIVREVERPELAELPSGIAEIQRERKDWLHDSFLFIDGWTNKIGTL